MPKKKNASSLISELKRKTRRTCSSEEKIRLFIDGMRGETVTQVEDELDHLANIIDS